MSSLINKTNDPNNSDFSSEKLIGSITGNKMVISGAQGGSRRLSDPLKQFTGGSSSNGGGGGLIAWLNPWPGALSSNNKRMVV